MITDSFSSDRLTFKILRETDVNEKYVSWLNNPEINRFLEVRFSKNTLATCKKFVNDMELDLDQYLFGIFEKETQKHIGNIKIGFINQNHKKAQLSYFIGEMQSWGKGYAVESVRAMTRWGFEKLGLERIEAGCYETNEVSKHILLKVGYTQEGYFRKSVVSDGQCIGAFWFGILKDDPIK